MMCSTRTHTHDKCDSIDSLSDDEVPYYINRMKDIDTRSDLIRMTTKSNGDSYIGGVKKFGTRRGLYHKTSVLK